MRNETTLNKDFDNLKLNMEALDLIDIIKEKKPKLNENMMNNGQKFKVDDLSKLREELRQNLIDNTKDSLNKDKITQSTKKKISSIGLKKTIEIMSANKCEESPMFNINDRAMTNIKSQINMKTNENKNNIDVPFDKMITALISLSEQNSAYSPNKTRKISYDLLDGPRDKSPLLNDSNSSTTSDTERKRSSSLSSAANLEILNSYNNHEIFNSEIKNLGSRSEVIGPIEAVDNKKVSIKIQQPHTPPLIIIEADSETQEQDDELDNISKISKRRSRFNSNLRVLVDKKKNSKIEEILTAAIGKSSNRIQISPITDLPGILILHNTNLIMIKRSRQ